MGALTFSKAGDVRPQCDNNICAPSAQEDLDTAGTFATVSTIAFVVGAAGAAAALVGLLLPPRPSSTRGRMGIALGIRPAAIGGTFW